MKDRRYSKSDGNRHIFYLMSVVIGNPPAEVDLNFSSALVFVYETLSLHVVKIGCLLGR